MSQHNRYHSIDGLKGQINLIWGPNCKAWLVWRYQAGHPPALRVHATLQEAEQDYDGRVATLVTISSPTALPPT